MMNRQSRQVLWVRALVDMGAVALAFLLSHSAYAALAESEIFLRFVPPPAVYAGLGILFGVGVVIFGLGIGSYGPGTSVLQYRETRAAVNAVWLSAASMFALLFLLKVGSDFSRILLTLAVLLSAGLIMIGRRFATPVLTHIQHSGNRNRRVAIVGAGKTARLVMKKIVQSPSTGLFLVGIVDDYLPLGSPLSCRLRQGESKQFVAPVLGRTWDILEIHRSCRLDLLVLALSDLARESVDDVVRMAEEIGIDVCLVPRLGDLRADQLELEDLVAIPVLKRSPIMRSRIQEGIKRGVDLTAAFLLVALTSPLWLLAAVATRLDSPGPVLFRQVRIGRDGDAFVMLKFRTMRVDADPFATSPNSNADPRITRVGRWLRLTGLDELPQLLNVLKGEMSLVGPRPEMPFIVDEYSELQRTRLLAPPGITGLWQLSPDRDAQIHDNIEYDIYYVRNRSLLLDLLILLETGLFTVGLLMRRILSADRIRRRLAAPYPEPELQLEPEASPNLLVALDQRVRGNAGPHWRACLMAARAVANSGSVKVLVAPRNVNTMTRLLAEDGNGGRPTDSQFAAGVREPVNGGEEDPFSSHATWRNAAQIELVPYRGSAELSRLAEAAAVVLTDLDHVREDVSASQRRTVVYVDESGGVSTDRVERDCTSAVVQTLIRVLQSADHAPAAE
jgi:exopolysaccharide biosynthesis polyprenyl glycosylphosphotransferase